MDNLATTGSATVGLGELDSQSLVDVASQLFLEESRNQAVAIAGDATVDLARRLANCLWSAAVGSQTRVTRRRMWAARIGANPAPVNYVAIRWRAPDQTTLIAVDLWRFPNHIHRAQGTMIKVERRALQLQQQIKTGVTTHALVGIVDPVGQLGPERLTDWSRLFNPVSFAASGRRWESLNSRAARPDDE